MPSPVQHSSPFRQRFRAVLLSVALLAIAGMAAQHLARAAVELEQSLASVPFAPGRAALPPSARGVLDHVASRLATDGKSRVELLAYASGSNLDSRARRLSLDRAVAVRVYLAKHGVDRSRVLLRPLGNRRSGGDSDCVEVVTLQ
jgi:outer membrane protein OmpA-like peptidoglycan-associated protein